MNLREILEKAGIASGLATMAIDAIAEKVNRDLERQLAETQTKLEDAEGRLSLALVALDEALARERDLVARLGKEEQ
jgi:hypothetical protein